MAKDTPFGQEVRMRVLRAYFAQAGEVAEDNAWSHVYRCLLWMNVAANLAHIYDSNHMQPGGVFHSRAVRFTDLLCKAWGIPKRDLPATIDVLFKGCVAEFRAQQQASGKALYDPDLESELLAEIEVMLVAEGVSPDKAPTLAKRIEAASRDFFTIGKKRNNALGEGFEDLLYLLLTNVAKVPPQNVALRTPVSKLPGFRKAPTSMKRKREPKPDIAICEGGITHVITTAKWSLRQDRETQLQSEYSAFQMNKVQSTELRYALITNEFDLARLRNVLSAMPGGAGGYIFHDVYHVCLPLLRETHGDRFKEIEPWVGTGKLKSLSAYLSDIRAQFGAA